MWHPTCGSLDPETTQPPPVWSKGGIRPCLQTRTAPLSTKKPSSSPFQSSLRFTGGAQLFLTLVSQSLDCALCKCGLNPFVLFISHECFALLCFLFYLVGCRCCCCCYCCCCCCCCCYCCCCCCSCF